MWKGCNKVFQKELKDNQNPLGYWEWPGSPHGPHSDLGKKIYATYLCSLMLTVYYRYLPMTSKDGAKNAAAKAPVKAAPTDGEETIDIFGFVTFIVGRSKQVGSSLRKTAALCRVRVKS